MSESDPTGYQDSPDTTDGDVGPGGTQQGGGDRPPGTTPPSPPTTTRSRTTASSARATSPTEGLRVAP